MAESRYPAVIDVECEEATIRLEGVRAGTISAKAWVEISSPMIDRHHAIVVRSPREAQDLAMAILTAAAETFPELQPLTLKRVEP